MSPGIDQARTFEALGVAVLTVSDTRNEETDSSGRYLCDAAKRAGHRVVLKRIVRDDFEPLVRAIDDMLGTSEVDVLLITGGTGVTARDVTPEACRQRIEKEIPGFGELFRAISLRSVGLAAIQSRALAGIAKGKLLFALPGSTGACKDAWTEILVHQLDSRYRPCNLAELLARIDGSTP